jgi:hypothetical protein
VLRTLGKCIKDLPRILKLQVPVWNFAHLQGFRQESVSSRFWAAVKGLLMTLPKDVYPSPEPVVMVINMVWNPSRLVSNKTLKLDVQPHSSTLISNKTLKLDVQTHSSTLVSNKTLKLDVQPHSSTLVSDKTLKLDVLPHAHQHA